MSDSKKSDSKNVNRREFFTKSGKIAAVGTALVSAPAINVLGANDMVSLGLIGSGNRGRYLMDQMHRMSIEEGKDLQFIGVADIYDTWRDQGISMAERMALDDVTGYDHHEKLLENPDIDAVVIATPEHQHMRQLIDSIQAGKDVFVEKPMVQNVQQGLEVLEANEGSGRVVQVGTQRRSVPLFYTAQEMVKSGAIGDVTYCEGWWHRNSRDGEDGPWAYDIPGDAGPDTINWDEFHYDAPRMDFDTQRYFQWRSFWEYSNGIGSDLMVHQIDAICLVMDVGSPKSVVASGGLYRWHDGRITPDTRSSIMEFEEGFQINYNARFSNVYQPDDKVKYAAMIDRMEDGPSKDSLKRAFENMDMENFFRPTVQDYGIRVAGSKALIEVLVHHAMHVWPDKKTWGDDAGIDYQYHQFGRSVDDATNLAVRLHLANFIDCLHSREDPNCTVEHGFHGAVISNMATLAFLEQKTMYWNKDTHTITSA